MNYADIKLLKSCSKDVQDRFHDELIHVIKENGNDDIVNVHLKRDEIWHQPDVKVSVLERRGNDWYEGETKEFHPIKWISLESLYVAAKAKMEKIDANDHHYLEYII